MLDADYDVGATRGAPSPRTTALHLAGLARVPRSGQSAILRNESPRARWALNAADNRLRDVWWAPQPDAACLLGGERFLGSLSDQPPLELPERR